MDVQSESSEPSPCDPQPPGKIRKAFKLFGKRKPGSIFSIRGKGEGNNKSPIARSKTVDGLKESVAAESELEKDKEPEKEQEPEVSQREEQEPEEEPLGDDGNPPIPSAELPSISSITSAKSLSFLMKLQRSRQGGVDRRFRTESQPTMRQRRGLKGLFGSMGWNQREDASDEADTPPSPLLMSSCTNSMEIIKEDMTLTPRPAPHSLDVPEPESGQGSPVSSKSPTVQESSASIPPETTALSAATYSVTGSNEDVASPLPTIEPPPLDPAVDRLRSLLADISSLISFDSLSGCGDITAEVEAEWGKASTTVGTGPGTKGAVAGESTSTTLSAKSAPSPIPTPAPTAANSASTTPIPMLTPSSAPTTKPEPTSWSIKPEPNPIVTTKPSTMPTTITSPTTKSSPKTKTSPPPTTKSTPSPAPIGITATSTFKPAPVVNSSPPPAPVVTSSPPPAPVVTSSPPPAPMVTSSPPPAPVVTSSPPPAPVVTSSPLPPPVVTSSPPPAPVVTSSPPPAPVVTSFPPAPVVTSFPPAPVVTSSPPAPVVTSSKPAPVTTPATFTFTPPPKISSAPCLDSITAPPSLTSFYPMAVLSSAFKIPFIPVPVPASVTSPAPVQTPSSILSDSKAPPAPTPTPIPMSKTPPFRTPAPNTTPVPMSKTTPVSAPAPVPSSMPSPVLTPLPLQDTPLASAQVKGCERKASLNRGEDMTSPNGMDVQGAWKNSPKREEKSHVTQNEIHMVPQGPPTEKKTRPVRAAGLSKIPVCGGGRMGKLPLRESQPTDHKGCWDPPITGLEEGSQRPSLRHEVSKDTISNSSTEAEVEASLSPVKHSPEESRQLRQPTVYRGIPRDSKIPVKLGVQCNIPVPQGAKELPRSKIPLSKVPVRRIGNKLTATTAASTQIRK
ncbi:APC membrane recruitment protein 2 [Oncorhynchus keta]|uniref:APC membrane recruitment protein 2 n=1 Tax=Oncorhynchus keta TaxID=8018 RepID=UPI00227CDE25|nr:APC membrane recruitment protein 2 [Oncorhynchus keta]